MLIHAFMLNEKKKCVLHAHSCNSFLPSFLPPLTPPLFICDKGWSYVKGYRLTFSTPDTVVVVEVASIPFSSPFNDSNIIMINSKWFPMSIHPFILWWHHPFNWSSSSLYIFHHYYSNNYDTNTVTGTDQLWSNHHQVDFYRLSRLMMKGLQDIIL